MGTRGGGGEEGRRRQEAGVSGSSQTCAYVLAYCYILEHAFPCLVKAPAMFFASRH